MNLFFKLAIIGLSAYGIMLFCHRQTAGFTLTAISSNLTYHPSWETRPLTSDENLQVEALLKQKFFFLNRGGQCYAFISEDGSSILKLFRLHRRRLPGIVMALPLPSFLESYRARKAANRSLKLYRDFNSYKLSFEELKEETALLFVHLNKTNYLKQQVTIVDKLGIEHRIDLDTTEFVLQKKVSLVCEELNALVQKGQLTEAQRRLDALLDLIVFRSKKGIHDEDAFLTRNFGFVGEKAVILDVGRFCKDPSRIQPEVYRADVQTIVNRFLPWLQENHPSLAEYLEEQSQCVE